MKKLIIILALVCFIGCKTKQKTVYEKEYLTTIDTIYKDKVVIKTEKVTDTFTIETPCNDKGEIKDFSRKIKTDKGFIIVYSINGKIKAELELNGTQDSKEVEKQIKYVDRDVIKEVEVIVTKYRYNWWLIIALIICLVYIIKKAL